MYDSFFVRKSGIDRRFANRSTLLNVMGPNATRTESGFLEVSVSWEGHVDSSNVAGKIERRFTSAYCNGRWIDICKIDVVNILSAPSLRTIHSEGCTPHVDHNLPWQLSDMFAIAHCSDRWEFRGVYSLEAYGCGHNSFYVPMSLLIQSDYYHYLISFNIKFLQVIQSRKKSWGEVRTQYDSIESLTRYNILPGPDT